MIQFSMPYFDVLFPLNIGPLTYSCPQEMCESAKAGMLVSARIKNRLTRGILLGRAAAPPEGRVKELEKIHIEEPALGKGLLKLVLWMSDYYLAHPGVVAKYTLPKQIFIRKKTRQKRVKDFETPRPDFISIPDSDIRGIMDSARSGKYGTFLLHAPSWKYEHSLAAAIIRAGLSNVLVILPEVSQADSLYFSLREICGDRLCLLHGGVAEGRRSEYIDGLMSGTRDIVIGTTPALFSPLRNISLIVVLQEHSGSYKLEEGIRYNVRDAAVMRGFLEKATVLLSSVTPSVDSCFNAFSGKYTLIRPEREAKRPRVRIVDMRFGKPVRPNISKTVFEVSKAKLGGGKKMIFVVNRRGHSSLLLCRECGVTEDCERCAIPLVYHKGDDVLRCHYCGSKRSVPQRCRRCGSHHLDFLGAGTQRVQEDIEELFGVKAIRFDSDEVRGCAEVGRALRCISGGAADVVVGTKMMTKRLAAGQFSAAAVLNIDSSLNFPDFRAQEKAYSELASIRELVEPGGEVLVQTRFPGNSLFRYLREEDYLSFVRGELAARKELFYPPYAKMMNIRFTGPAAGAEEIVRAAGAFEREIEVLGPAAVRTGKTGEFSILLKSRNRKALRAAAKEILRRFGKGKERRIVIDVDPA